ncbi:aminodeoxychorismate synthase component I, partial [Micromonospora echinospora]
MSNPPAAPPACRHTLVEHARLEWRPTDGGDPATIVEDFLTAHGLPVTDLTRPTHHDPTGICGASLYVSATAGALMAG